MAGAEQVRYADNATIAGELLALEDKAVLDVGCGEGRFTRILARAGASVTGLDVSRAALDIAEARARQDGIAATWVEGRAERLPLADQSFDIVVYSNSLHHVAPDEMDRAMAEAARVLRPGGLLYIMEPVAEGDYFEATRMVNDERAVRVRAREAIDEAASRLFSAEAEVTYRAERLFDSFEAYAEEQARRGERRARILAEKGAEMRQRFLAAARRKDGKLAFDQMFRVNLLRKRG